MPSLINSNAGPISNMTWGEAARRVARVAGGTGFPDIEQAAKEAISEILQEWNTEDEWRWTQIIAPDITTANGTARYSLPTNYKKPYDAYLVGAKRKLEYVEARTYDSILPGYTTAGAPGGYSLYNDGAVGEIELVPPPGSEDTLVVRYFRLLAAEVQDDDAQLGVPARYTSCLLAGARAILCAEKEDNALAYWEGKYQARLNRMKADDRRLPDEGLAFLSVWDVQNRNLESLPITSTEWPDG